MKLLAATMLSLTCVSATVAVAKTAPDHVSAEVTDQVRQKFDTTMKASGIEGVVTDIRTCYATLDGNKSAAKDSRATCLLYDISAYALNQGMIEMRAKQGGADPSKDPVPAEASGYLSDQQFNARLDKYAPALVGDKNDAISAYFGDAPKDIVTSVAHDFVANVKGGVN